MPETTVGQVSAIATRNNLWAQAWDGGITDDDDNRARAIEATADVTTLLAIVRDQQTQLQAAQDDAWKRGYDACKTGQQRHSPYSSHIILVAPELDVCKYQKARP